MKLLLKLFPAGHLLISVLFIVSVFMLLAFAGYELWEAIFPDDSGVDGRLDAVLNGIALLTIAVGCAGRLGARSTRAG